MKYLLFLLLFCLPSMKAEAQLYFPPVFGSSWATTPPSELGWCQDSIDVLYDFLENSDTKAFILLKKGKIVLEKYFGTFTADSLWVWNSAGKTLTALAIGIAQEEGHLNIHDTTAQYLGNGWTNLTPEQEEKITIRHQLTMTSGLTDTGDIYCTDPSCLNYMADPGTRWAYHNGPYTLLDGVIENVTGMTLNQWVNQKICSPIGMSGFYYPFGYNNVFISNARSMARFGLLLEGEGIWNGNPVLDDPQYFQEMTTPSQTINPSYGYLTWLNGQSSFMIPQLQFSFSGNTIPNAPNDVFASLGKNGQIINVAPGDSIVFIRMGATQGNSLVGNQYNDTIWMHINNLSCPLETAENIFHTLRIVPNPVNSFPVTIEGLQPDDLVYATDLSGKRIPCSRNGISIHPETQEPGIYLITINRSGHTKTLRLLVN